MAKLVLVFWVFKQINSHLYTCKGLRFFSFVIYLLSIRVFFFCKVTRLGGKNDQFWHNRGIKSLTENENLTQNEITVIQTSFSINFDKLSFIPSFLFIEHLRSCYIYFYWSYLCNYYNYPWTFCSKWWVSAFHTEI
jgi:hypothetical protein